MTINYVLLCCIMHTPKQKPFYEDFQEECKWHFICINKKTCILTMNVMLKFIEKIQCRCIRFYNYWCSSFTNIRKKLILQKLVLCQPYTVYSSSTTDQYIHSFQAKFLQRHLLILTAFYMISRALIACLIHCVCKLPSLNYKYRFTLDQIDLTYPSLHCASLLLSLWSVGLNDFRKHAYSKYILAFEWFHSIIQWRKSGIIYEDCCRHQTI